MRELDGIDCASRADNIGDVGDGRAGSSTEIENLRTRLHEDGLETAEDTSGQLAAERIPDTVLGLGGRRVAVFALRGVLDDNTLLAVDGFAGAQVLSREEILLAAAGDENALVTMGFLEMSVFKLRRMKPSLAATYDNHLLATSCAAAASTASPTTSAIASPATVTSTATARCSTASATAATVAETTAAYNVSDDAVYLVKPGEQPGEEPGEEAKNMKKAVKTLLTTRSILHHVREGGRENKDQEHLQARHQVIDEPVRRNEVISGSHLVQRMRF
jgi:hypothetical protein